ncbi:MAG TPA: GNAT family N-acetyltransferase [Planococcus sp. (in: firmicutes)]|nr:GNAT family N-acetyltransferase [Planococcus sp. (in: firmicutes)]
MEWGHNKETTKKIEDIKRKGTHAYFLEYQKQSPAFTGASLTLSGKGDVFCSGASCHGLGFGTDGALASTDIDELENFVRKKRADFSLFLEITPHADEKLIKRLQLLGYTLDHFLNVWLIDLEQWQPMAVDARSEAIVEKVDDENVHEWAWAVALGISDDDYQAEVAVESVKAFWQVEGNTAFLVRENGECTGGGCMAIDGELAELFMTATLPAKRRKGYQALLIDERLGYAKAAGCTHVTVTTKPGTSSARNVERSGFQLAYDKAVLRSPRLE